MDGLKTYSFLLFLTFCLQAPMARAYETPDQQLRIFANCAGRLSALMEHQWMFDGAASEHTKAVRATVLSFIEATLPSGQGREVLSWRIEAKMAHAALLTRATFNDDQADAQWAAQTAQHQTAQCRALLLG